MTVPTEPLLKEEYFRLHEIVEKFDEKSLTIKAWSVTLAMAGIGAAFSERTPVLLLLAGVASILFWIIEAAWKTFQQAYYPRIGKLEDFFAGRSSEITPLQINASWLAAWRAGRDRGDLRRIMLWPHVFLPHVVIGLGGPCLWMLNLLYPIVPLAKSP